ncbi:MAG: CPBP family intramembrane metalloprotease [Anaerolineaceae bacterium]|nr:CPBP family intramembrane metalloprotease [Anaerolineaceae bacterium]
MEQHPARPGKFPWLFFVLAFAITWVIWSPGVMAALGWFELPAPFMLFFFIGTWGPFIAAMIVTYRETGRGGITAFLKRGFNFRIAWRWWLVIFLLPLLVSALPLGIHLLLGGPAPESGLVFQPLMILPVFLTYLVTGGGNEEWGWRGYALDRLEQRWNPLAASLLLGVIWGAWHLPLFFIESTGQYHMLFWIFLASTPGISILHSWIYHRTGRNLLAAWLFHAALGTAWEVFPIVQPQLSGYGRVYIFDLGLLLLLGLGVWLVMGKQLGKQEDAGSSIATDQT